MQNVMHFEQITKLLTPICGVKNTDEILSLLNSNLNKKSRNAKLPCNLDILRTKIQKLTTTNFGIVKTRESKIRKLHTALLCKNDKQCVCINRDLNVCLNMLKLMRYLFDHALETNTEMRKPEKFRKSYKFTDNDLKRPKLIIKQSVQIECNQKNQNKFPKKIIRRELQFRKALNSNTI